MFTPTSGKIIYNEIPQEMIDIDSLRERITYNQQKPYIFNSTVYQNITCDFNNEEEDQNINRFKSITDKLMLNSIAENLIKYEVGNRGEKLSGGQHQRIAFARSVFREKTSIFLMK